MATDWYNEITTNILQLLDQGIIPWRKTWQGDMISAQSGKAYQGINQFQLEITAVAKGYSSNVWVTFNEAKKRGGSIRKGEHGIAVFKWVAVTQKEESPNGQAEGAVAFMRMAYAGTVFNLDQTDGVTVSDLPLPVAKDTIAQAESVYANMPNRPDLTHGGDMACYYPQKDRVNMPHMANFESSESYYSVLFHELGHATGHHSRLARKEVMAANYFGSHDYSAEELVAEFTAAFLCGKVGIAQPETVRNSAAYIQGWSAKFRKDKGLIINAAQRAQKAVNYILRQSEPQEI